MAFYWSIRSVPELAGVPRAKRAEIWRQSMWSGMASRRYIAVSVVSIITLYICLAVFGAYGALVLVLGWPVLLFGGGVLFRAMAINGARPKMAQLANEYRAEEMHDHGLQEDPAETDRWKADRWKAVALMLTILGGGAAMAALVTGLVMGWPVHDAVLLAFIPGIVGLLFGIWKCAIGWNDF